MRHLFAIAVLVPFFAAAAEDTPEKAVSALWRALSNDPGSSADVATLERLFHEDAVIFGGLYKEGAPVMRRSSVTEFLKLYAGPQKNGFYECEVTRSLKTYDRFAVAYSVVESRSDKAAAAPDFTGINSIQLYKVGSQWKVLSLYYHVEAKEMPIPLEGGRSGTCLQ